MCDKSNKRRRWKNITCASEIQTTFTPRKSQIRETFSATFRMLDAAVLLALLSCEMAAKVYGETLFMFQGFCVSVAEKVQVVTGFKNRFSLCYENRIEFSFAKRKSTGKVGKLNRKGLNLV